MTNRRDANPTHPLFFDVRGCLLCFASPLPPAAATLAKVPTPRISSEPEPLTTHRSRLAEGRSSKQQASSRTFFSRNLLPIPLSYTRRDRPPKPSGKFVFCDTVPRVAPPAISSDRY